jgi:acetyltransferase-like isoleucine patch superfamily enzyme
VAKAELALCLRGRGRIGAGTEVHGRVYVHGEGRIELGERVILDGRACPIELHASEGALIVIGDDVVIDAGASIEARERVQIGRGCRLGRFCKILDNDFHPLRGDRHEAPSSKPVTIEDEVVVGAMAVLLPGAYVERGVTIGPSKVITRRVAATREKPSKAAD